ncbi:MAG: murein biosynthesis integral membrane protein MurJ [Candidatus Omnitrophota bacterium]
MESNKENTRVAKSATIVFLISGIRWVLACARIVFVAYLFGAALSYDAYLVAFTLPEIIMELLVGVIGITFIPIFTDYLVKEGEVSAWNFASNLINILLIIGIFLTILMGFMAPTIVRIVAPSFDSNSFQLAVRIMVLIIPLILIVSLADLITRILHSYQRFTAVAFSRVFELIAVIICLVLFSKEYGIFSLAIGLVSGALVRLIFQFPFLWNKFKYYQLKLNFALPGIKKVIFISGPIISCMIFLRIGKIIERALASSLKEGSISVLSYANAFNEVPRELFLCALGVVLFPLISKYASENKMDNFKAVISKGIRVGNFILIPIAISFIFFGKQIIGCLLERGEFVGSMTQDTSIALAIYALTLLVMAVYYFCAQACYALQEVKPTIKFAIIVLVIDIILKLILINYLSFAGLALATSISLIIHSGLLAGFIRKKIGSFDERAIFLSSLKTLGVSLLMAGTCWFVLSLVPYNVHRVMRLTILMGTAGISYIAFSYLSRSQELLSVGDLLRNMVFKAGRKI